MSVEPVAPPQSSLVTAAVLIIGNEILSGRTQDTNLAYLAGKLNEYGIQIRQARVVPDIERDIVEAVNALRARYDKMYLLPFMEYFPLRLDLVRRRFGRAREFSPGAATPIFRLSPSNA